jgi:hypothetical protein
MTGEEITRFAMQLREAERIRARIAEEEAVVHTSGGESPLVAAVPAVEPPSVPAAVAAA